MSLFTRGAVLMAAIGALALPARTAAAQTTTFNLAAGLALPNGNFGDAFDAGYTLIVGIGVTQRASPISLRAEGIYTEYNAKVTDFKGHAGGVTGNAVYDFSTSTGMFTPYAIGGIGLYSTKVNRFNDDSETNVGWNLGGGLRFPLTGFSAYVEARYHSISGADVSFTPIVFGLRF